MPLAPETASWLSRVRMSLIWAAPPSAVCVIAIAVFAFCVAAENEPTCEVSLIAMPSPAASSAALLIL